MVEKITENLTHQGFLDLTLGMMIKENFTSEFMFPHIFTSLRFLQMLPEYSVLGPVRRLLALLLRRVEARDQL